MVNVRVVTYLEETVNCVGSVNDPTPELRDGNTVNSKDKKKNRSMTEIIDNLVKSTQEACMAQLIASCKARQPHFQISHGSIISNMK